MAVRDDFAAGEVLAAADLNDTFASKLDIDGRRIVQVNVSSDSTTRTTTSTSYSSAGISIPITPLYSDSSLLIMWTFVGETLRSGTGTFSYGRCRITTSTDVALSGAEDVIFGVEIAPSPAESHGWRGMQTLIGRFGTAGTTSELTFKGQYCVNNAGTTVTLNQDTVGRMYAIEVSN